MTDPVELAQILIRAPSPNPPGDERAVADAVEELARGLGLPAPQRVALDARRPNLLIERDFGPGGRHLVLSGHMDTKPVGDADWTVDPFGAELDGDRLYGLGSADMKAALAAMLTAAASLELEAGRVTLLFTADEEDGAAFGARHVAEHVHLAADGVVIGEPGGIEEDFDRLHLVSRGIARLRLVAMGRQGHSSLADELGMPSAGVDAARAVVAVEDGLALDEPADEHGLAGWGVTVNTGLAYRGGVGFGVLPGRMAVDTEVRLLPNMDRGDVQTALENAVDGVAVEWDAPPTDWLPATMVDPEDPLALAAATACRTALGREPVAAVFPGTTDATFFREPTLPALGPGLLRRAHAADEWVSADAVRRSVALYGELARGFCA